VALRQNLSEYRKLIGTNIAAMKYAIKHVEEHKAAKIAFEDDILNGPDVPAKKSKRKRGSRGGSGESANAESASAAGDKKKKKRNA
jgi:hypothetical protein